MLQLRVNAPHGLPDEAVALLRDDPAVSALTVHAGATLQPEGDVVLADVAGSRRTTSWTGWSSSGSPSRARSTSNRSRPGSASPARPPSG